MAKKKQKGIKVIECLDCGIFPVTVMFSCGFNYGEIMDVLKERKAHDWYLGLTDKEEWVNKHPFSALHRTIEHGKSKQVKELYYIILTEPFLFRDGSYVILAHEVLHICQFVLPRILKRDEELEAEAYLHSHLMKQCLTALRGKKI